MHRPPTLCRRPDAHGERPPFARVLRLAAILGAVAVTDGANAQETARGLDPVVVTATRSVMRAFDAPASVDAIDAATLHEGQPMVNLSETLARVPGLTALNRQNYAQDLQISSRGFGARSAFGVRGIRIYQDDIPQTMPDGQGQTGSISLFSSERIEVLRGPFSTLYGNASGGVISIYTESGTPTPELDLNAGAGSYGSWTTAVKLSGSARPGPLQAGYVAAASRFETDGFRAHSAAQRDLANGKLTIDAGPDTRVTLVASSQYQPETQDPLGLTRTQWQSDPRSVDPAALVFDTRKTIRQAQAGIALDQRFGPSTSLKLVAYDGARQVRQYLALSGVGPTSSGGVTDLDRTYGGIGVRLNWQGRIGVPLAVTAGVDVDRQQEHRRGFVNDNGRLGDLRRDEDDRVESTAVYAQARLSPVSAVDVTAGVRSATVRFRSDDHYITALNPDDSGRKRFGNTSPVLGVVWHARDRVNVYASYGRGFETPTLIELAYRNGGSGLNFGLEPATSRAFEAGVKVLVSDRHRLNVAAFTTSTDNEIVIDAATGGRTTYRNAGRTLRRGLEASWDGRLADSLSAYAAFTVLRATFEDGFVTGTPPMMVPEGARLPGVPNASAYAELAWTPRTPAGLSAAIEVQHQAKVYVNERNSDAAPSATLLHARIGLEQRVGRLHLREYVRVNNVTDRRYAGSVIVGDTNGRYFEPAPGRNWFAGVTARAAF